VRIRMPALRQRTEDIPQIVDFCLQNLVKQKKARVTKVSPEAMNALTRHTWPGNVRELENVIYRSAVIAQGDAILVKDLPAEIRRATGEEAEPAAAAATGGEAASAGVAAKPGSVAPFAPAEVSASAAPSAAGEASLTVERAIDFLFETLRGDETSMLGRIEQELIKRALAAEAGDATKAAKLLGVTKATLMKRAKEV